MKTADVSSFSLGMGLELVFSTAPFRWSNPSGSSKGCTVLQSLKLEIPLHLPHPPPSPPPSVYG